MCGHDSGSGSGNDIEEPKILVAGIARRLQECGANREIDVSIMVQVDVVVAVGGDGNVDLGVGVNREEYPT